MYTRVTYAHLYSYSCDHVAALGYYSQEQKTNHDLFMVEFTVAVSE